MKRISILLVLVLIVTFLCGCQKSHSQIIQENGNYYLVLNNLHEDNSHLGLKLLEYIDFESIDEMLTYIRRGSFTDEELDKISTFSTDSQGRIFMFDITSMLEPVYTESITDYDVRWYGSYYSFSMQTDAPDTIITLHFYPEEFLENAYEVSQSLLRNPDYCNILSTEYDSERKAYIVCYDDGDTVYKVINYTVNNANAIYRIQERYYVSGYLPNEKINLDQSETVPYQIGIYTSKNDHHFLVTVNLPTERPSIEWLTQFDVREYTPD